MALAESQRLRAVSAAAGRLHVRAGMTVAEARAICAALEVLPWDEVMVRAELTRATAAFLAASPQVTPATGRSGGGGIGMWWIGAGGFDGLGGERALARELSAIARRWHPRPRVAIADSCVAARAATWGMGGEGGGEDVIVPPGGDAAYLAPAPLGLIPMDAELRETLFALGIRTAGSLAALAGEEVERRWGEAAALAAWRLARGDDPRRPVLARPDVARGVSVELPAPADTVEPVLFLVRSALDRLVRGLVADGRAAAAVALTLGEGGRGTGTHTVTREIRPARPLARVAPLFEQCRALLDGWTLGAPVEVVTVAVTATAPLPGEQGDLLDAGWRDPAAVEAAFARLRSELGPDAIVRPAARDEHRPERAGAWVPVADGIADASPAPLPDRPDDDAAAPRRLLEVPESVDVEPAGGGREGAPRAIWWRGRRIAIARATGPERLAGDWWRDGYSRDYWRCESDDSDAGGGAYFILFRDRGRAPGNEAPGGASSGTGRWYLHGWYD